VVSAVTNFGLFVELNGLYIEGLVHITSLPGDYYRFDHAQQRLVGERSGRSFQLGCPTARAGGGGQSRRAQDRSRARGPPG
jgi:exoribonuclease R